VSPFCPAILGCRPSKNSPQLPHAPIGEPIKDLQAIFSPRQDSRATQPFKVFRDIRLRFVQPSRQLADIPFTMFQKFVNDRQASHVAERAANLCNGLESMRVAVHRHGNNGSDGCASSETDAAFSAPTREES
jgi:hypothetical protein